MPSGHRRLDGLAVISEIVASKKPLEAAKRLAHLIGAFKALDMPPIFSFVSNPTTPLNSHYFVQEAGKLLGAIRDLTPLVHQVRWALVYRSGAQRNLDHQHSCHYTVSKCDSCAQSFSYYGQCPRGDAGS